MPKMERRSRKEMYKVSGAKVYCANRSYSSPKESSLLPSEDEWRKLIIDLCPQEHLGEELQCVLCCCLEGLVRRCDLEDNLG